jgi:hypothetical protein
MVGNGAEMGWRHPGHRRSSFGTAPIVRRDPSASARYRDTTVGVRWPLRVRRNARATRERARGLE